MDKIRLLNLLPRVFEKEDVDAISAASQVFLHDVVFERGKYYCINASSGSGKTSLCSFIYGLRTDYSGSIYFDDVDAASLRIPGWCALRRGNIALLSQELDLFDELSAIDNVQLKNRLTGFRKEDEIDRFFDILGIQALKDRLAGQMSVGQKQRVAVIRALCQPFDFLILDEPVSHLDADNNIKCAALILEAARAQGAGIIFTSVGNPLALDAPITTLNL